MQFTPKTPEDFEAEREANRLKPGEYDAIIVDAIEETGKFGPQMKLKIQVLAERTKDLIDWVGATTEKLRFLCEALAIMDRYDAGTLEPADFINRECRVTVVDGRPNAEGRVFPRIRGYLPAAIPEVAPLSPPPKASTPLTQAIRDKVASRPPVQSPVSSEAKFAPEDIPF